MSKRMLINVVEPEECRIAILDGSMLDEIYVERSSTETYLGNIYKGQIVSVEPSIQAAFVDFGADRNGFLHVSDVMPAYGRRNSSNGGSRRRDIQSMLRRGQEVLVQISKDSIGTKVPTLTTYVSLAGRYLVLMPSISKRGVSKKINNEKERKRLRRIVEDLLLKGMGYIVRTAGSARSEDELSRDLSYLLNLWKAISRRVKQEPSPCTIYEESDLVIRTIRDVYSDDIEEIVIDERGAYKRCREFIKEVMPDHLDRVKLYTGNRPLFSDAGLEDELERMYDRKVPLKSGGSIIIEQTEALVAIDVNSGKYKDKNSLEETAYRTNLEAAREICRNLRMRDLGGVIVCDFIDMREEKHRKAVEREFRKCLRSDRARTRLAPMSRFCILELTRQRVKKSIKRTVYEICPCCKGIGLVKTVESMALKLIRHIQTICADSSTPRVEITAHPDVVTYLQNAKRDQLVELEKRFNKPIRLRTGAETNNIEDWSRN